MIYCNNCIAHQKPWGLITWSINYETTHCVYCGRKMIEVTDEELIITKTGNTLVSLKHQMI